ncbi:hypothetical protein FRACA_540022 [Frankia canadensis]|uniref:Uncharacterized protein n=1 Tax=Frankia canadensis TaxID=1836972 RepID=A0A2I2KYV4_9ACTN|nr:hypothetical protein FRACA_540022 [Frankia canadensis]SOU58126.1 hypothetical protein FRACA_540022 [Frankia canadensis]
MTVATLAVRTSPRLSAEDDPRFFDIPGLVPLEVTTESVRTAIIDVKDRLRRRLRPGLLPVNIAAVRTGRTS